MPDESPKGFGRSDASDGGRKLGDWKSVYPEPARKEIRNEAIYVFLVTSLYFFLTLYLIYLDCINCEHPGKFILNLPHNMICSLASFAAGGIGGGLFGLKWMYHSVARKIWHQDRWLWRYLTPHMSAALSLIMLLLIKSGIFKIFDHTLAEDATGCIAVGFLVGYFSDKALAKMAEIADTIFGTNDNSSSNNSKADNT